MARKTGSRGFVVGVMNTGRLVLIGGVVWGVGGIGGIGGCGKGDRWWKDNNEPVTGGGEATEVDSSLTALSDDAGPVVAVDGDGAGFGSTQDQVIESARMMDEYFSGMAAGEDLEESVVVGEAGEWALCSVHD